MAQYYRVRKAYDSLGNPLPPSKANVIPIFPYREQSVGERSKTPEFRPDIKLFFWPDQDIKRGDQIREETAGIPKDRDMKKFYAVEDGDRILHHLEIWI